MGKNWFDSFDISRRIQRNLKKSKKKYDTYNVLKTIRESVIEEYNNSNINIEFDDTELYIYSTKKKSNKMKEITTLVNNILDDMIDPEVLDLLFDINMNKNSIYIKCKRKIEH